MIGASTFLNPIFKVVTTVAILAAVYFFILRPVLDTTESVSRSVADQTRQALEEGRQRAAETQTSVALNVAHSRINSFANSLLSTWPAASRAVRKCEKAAGDNPDPLERCEDFAETLVHTVQSDRSFALSYATSLNAQGRTGDAQRVEDCVEKAGFKAPPMQRCRDLSYDLLFG